MKDYAVKVENISKIYELKNKNNQYKKDKKRFYALKDVSFEIQKGDVVGILGTNGSGKSTLSLVLAGISDIDSGSVHVNGEQALISINTGLNQQLTGLENIRVKGALMGLKKKRIDEIIDDVVNFAELGDFLYQPVKKYSSGMKSRLGFSISLALNPDIFIVDEALSVGDKGFAKKCMDRMMQLRDDEGKTIFFVSAPIRRKALLFFHKAAGTTHAPTATDYPRERPYAGARASICPPASRYIPAHEPQYGRSRTGYIRIRKLIRRRLFATSAEKPYLCPKLVTKAL